jgi:ribosome-associated heat shock protein Hsp15
MSAAETESTRLDKWLWAVRLYKTRALAVDACKRGQVVINGSKAKPSRQINRNCVIEVRYPTIVKTVRVLQILDNRVGAKLVPEYLEDLTPEEEQEKAQRIRSENRLNRVFNVPGQGRPDKRQLREIRKFLDLQEGESGEV